MNKWEQECKIAELIAESEEQRRFDEFYEKIPNVVIRHKTQESHLPLIFISSADGEQRTDRYLPLLYGYDAVEMLKQQEVMTNEQA